MRSFITVSLLDIVRAVSRNVWRRRHYAIDVRCVCAIYSVATQTNNIFFQFRDGLQHVHIQCSNGIVRNDAYFHVHVQISSFDETIEGVCIGKQQRAAGSIFGF